MLLLVVVEDADEKEGIEEEEVATIGFEVIEDVETDLFKATEDEEEGVEVVVDGVDGVDGVDDVDVDVVDVVEEELAVGITEGSEGGEAERTEERRERSVVKQAEVLRISSIHTAVSSLERVIISLTTGVRVLLSIILMERGLEGSQRSKERNSSRKMV